MSIAGERPRLLQRRIRRILLVSSLYDQYIIEEEGRLLERISQEYEFLHLTNAPMITQAPTSKGALAEAENQEFDLVITSLRVGEPNAFLMAEHIKQMHPGLPVVLLTSEVQRVSQIRKRVETRHIDRIYYWHGDARLFLAIIKSEEDRLNAPHDLITGHVRLIILVEDSPQFYSNYLPIIYTEVMEQTRALISENVSSEEKLFRMSARPKIMMAETFEEAEAIYRRYPGNLLGVICDVRFPRNGELDSEAGIALVKMVREGNPDVPVLLQSFEPEAAKVAERIGATFADKNSPYLFRDLRHFVSTNFGFGDFVFRLPSGQALGRASNLEEMHRLLSSAPTESLEYHANLNHFSNWLFARGELEIATRVRPMAIRHFASVEDLRQELVARLAEAVKTTQRAVVTDFDERVMTMGETFIRFGGGSIGGKARGIAFVQRLLAHPYVREAYGEDVARIPQTAVVGTDEFDRFLEDNNLYSLAMESRNDEEIAQGFLEGDLGKELDGQLRHFLCHVAYPLAIRSSGLSEDSLSQPFAGLYSTYMIPNNHPDVDIRMRQLRQAIKLVYASSFYQSPKAYLRANALALEGEKMAVIIEELVGRRHGRYFYPHLAGVAQSHNFFPVSYMKPEDGIAQLVLGLGIMAVEGDQSLRFSPAHPTILPQFSEVRDILANSQRTFVALDMEQSDVNLTRAKKDTLAILGLDEAEHYGTLDVIGAVYVPEEKMIYQGLHHDGQRLVTFQRLLRGEQLALPKALSTLLEVGSWGMGTPVEIEFAANLADLAEPPQFYFLQMRPLVVGGEFEEVAMEGIKEKDCVARTTQALGNGTFDDIRHLVYVKDYRHDPSEGVDIAKEIGEINAKLLNQGEQYILLGYGRWGTTNLQLGIPVEYAQISAARVIAEVSIDDYKVEASQGTHFFHNITASRSAYFAIDTSSGGKDYVDWNWLKAQPSGDEGEYIRHIRTDSPMIVRVDGRKGVGMILKSGVD